jgi:hypothetical protein
MTARSLSARLAALEARGRAVTDPIVVEIVIVGAKDGRPNGQRTDWHAYAPEVVVAGERYAVAADETATMAVRRIVAAMNPAPRAVVALVPEEG